MKIYVMFTKKYLTTSDMFLGWVNDMLGFVTHLFFKFMIFFWRGVAWGGCSIKVTFVVVQSEITVVLYVVK